MNVDLSGSLPLVFNNRFVFSKPLSVCIVIFFKSKPLNCFKNGYNISFIALVVY